MQSNPPITRMSTLGQRHPRQVAIVRVGVGIWLLVLTAILYGAGHGGWWEGLLVATALLHFGLAYRLVRIARRATPLR
jgi:membrane protease YdiL (CAAX protease family)